MFRRPLFDLAVLVALAAAGCGRSSPNGASGGAGGSGGGAGAAGASSAGGASGTAGADAGGDGDAVTCTASVQDLCGTYASQYCTPTWSAVLAGGPFCSNGSFNGPEVFVCGGYNVRKAWNVDVGWLSFYDPVTGALVAVWGEGMGGSHCLGGPPGFTPPDCPTLSCPALGTDAGAGDAGGCAQSLAVTCATSLSKECTPTWAALAADNSYCAGYAPDGTYSCGSYQVHRIDYIDTATLSFYDAASGALVAIESLGMATDGCVGGPADFVAPSCPDPQITRRSCSDAGADGGP